VLTTAHSRHHASSCVLHWLKWPNLVTITLGGWGGMPLLVW